jgi:two-component system, OmpR family, sensor histidine kinase CiaH
MKLIAWYKKNKLTIATWVYWFLLFYILAALVWWFIELLQQNNEMYLFKRELLNYQDPNFQAKLNFLEQERQTNFAQYLGEGLTFMFLMLLGAVFVYRAVRRQIKLKEQQQNFMMAVTHELKTPIAITKLNLETLLKRKLDPGQQEKLISNAIQETGRLNDLCENILLSTRIDSGRYFSNKEDLNLATLIEFSVKDLRSRFPKRTITTELVGNSQYFGDPLLLQLLFNNLIENALKYSGPEDPVDIRLLKKLDGWKLEVADFGAGIPDVEKKKIFEKFYRVGSEATRATKGTGLGLYLSQKIAEDHYTGITVTDNQPKGSIFIIEFN